MTEIASLAFAVDTRPLLDVDAVLTALQKNATSTEAALTRMATSTRTAFANVAPGMASMLGGGSGSGSVTTSSANQATAAISAQTTALQAATTAHKSHGAAAYQNSLAMMEVAHVGRALFDEMAAGGNIFRALAMESGRLQIAYGSLQNSGLGVGGALSQIGTKLSGLLSPLRLVAAGTLAVGAAAAAAFSTFENGQDGLARSLDGYGRRSGATMAQLNAVAASGSRAAGLSTGEGISLAAGFTSAGLSAGTTGSLIGASRAYGRLTGVGTDQAGASLADALRDPVRGMGELDKQLGFVDDALAQTVKNLEASGHLQEAQALLAGRLNDALARTTDTTWGLTRAFDDAKNFMANAFHGAGGAIANALGYQNPADKLDADRAAVANLQRVDPIGNADEIADLNREIDRLAKVVKDDSDNAAAKKRDADATANSRLAGDAVRSILPNLENEQKLANWIELLRGSLSNQLEMQKMTAGGIGQSQVQQAFGNAVVMQANANPARRQREDYELSLAASDAFSTGETGIVAARRAELAILRQYGDVSRAATAAQMTLNEAVAKRNADSKDELELARQAGNSIGLRGFDASQQAIRNRYEGVGGIFARDAVATNDVRKDPGIGGDLAAASHRVELALDDLPPRVEAAGSKLVTALDLVANRVGAITLQPGAGDSRTGGATLGKFDYAHASGAAVATPAMIADAAARTGVPANIIAAIGQIENSGRLTGGTSMLGSNGKPSSAYGFGQLTNGAAADVRAVVPGFDKYNPDTAVFGSAEYLSILAGRNGGNLNRALNAYGGTDDYASKVMRTAGSPLTIGVSGGSTAGVAPIQNQALGSDKLREQVDFQHDAQEKNLAPLQDAMIALGQQNDMLKVQHAALRLQSDDYATSAGKIAAMTEEQKLLGEYSASQLRQFPILRDSIKNVADQYGEAAEAAATLRKQQHDLTEAMDGLRSGVGDGLHTFIDDLMKGKSAGTAFRDVLEGLGQKMLSLGESMLTNSLFGAQGSSGGGLFGGLFSKLFSFGGGGGGIGAAISGGLGHNAQGTDDWRGGLTEVGERGPEIVNLPAHAQVIPNGKGFGGGLKVDMPIAGHTIVIQGNADKDTAAMIDRKLAASNEALSQQIMRNLHTLTASNQQYSG